MLTNNMTKSDHGYQGQTHGVPLLWTSSDPRRTAGQSISAMTDATVENKKMRHEYCSGLLMTLSDASEIGYRNSNVKSKWYGSR